jgi:alpha-D-ribose 1-methylphosphonate 5-triphosphate diphosphatase PhnM
MDVVGRFGKDFSGLDLSGVNFEGGYQCRPAASTNRSSNVALDRVAVLDTGVTTMLCSYDFGGDTSEVQVPLTRDGKQWVVVELGWKSSLDLTQ